jgi:hypothetical protein
MGAAGTYHALQQTGETSVLSTGRRVGRRVKKAVLTTGQGIQGPYPRAMIPVWQSIGCFGARTGRKIVGLMCAIQVRAVRGSNTMARCTSSDVILRIGVDCCRQPELMRQHFTYQWDSGAAADQDHGLDVVRL